MCGAMSCWRGNRKNGERHMSKRRSVGIGGIEDETGGWEAAQKGEDDAAAMWSS